MRPTVLVVAAVLSAVDRFSSAAGNATAHHSWRSADARTSITRAAGRAGSGCRRTSTCRSAGHERADGDRDDIRRTAGRWRARHGSGEGPPRTTSPTCAAGSPSTALRAGRYYVSVFKQGYVTVSYGQRRVNSQGTAVPLGGRRNPRDRHAAAAWRCHHRHGARRAGRSRGGRVRPGDAVHDEGGERRPQQSGGDNDRRPRHLSHAFTAAGGLRGVRDPAQHGTAERRATNSDRRSNGAPDDGHGTVSRCEAADATRLADLQGQLPAQGEPVDGYAPVCFPGSSPTPRRPFRSLPVKRRAGSTCS